MTTPELPQKNWDSISPESWVLLPKTWKATPMSRSASAPAMRPTSDWR